jgi:multicomponent Na+:H+ antiporter subunit E
MNNNQTKKDNTTVWHIKLAAIGIEFVILYIFWIVLSGHFEIKWLVIGMVASGLVTYLTHDIFIPDNTENWSGIRYLFRSTLRFVLYLPWLTLAIIKANLQVAAILIKPRMPIDPVMLKFESKLKHRISLVTLANSITLTPGTITVELEKGMYIVHSLVPGCAGDLETGVMQHKVAWIFGDHQDTTSPHCSWTRYLPELD